MTSPGALSMRLMLAFSFMFAAVAGACSVPKASHCANQGGLGDAYCKALSVDTPHCSSCTADNNGCVAEPVTDATCEVGSTSVGSTSTTSPTTSTGDATSTAASSTSTTEPVDPSTSSSTSLTTDPTTSSSSSTGDDTTSTSSSSTGDDTTSTSSTDTTDTTDTTTSTTTDESTDETTDTADATTMDGPMCGDNLQEDPEICDGNDLNGLNCVLKNPAKYGGGSLTCAANCTAYDETQCCLSLDQSCTPNAGQKCCPGLKCTLLLGLGKCKPV